MSGIKSFFKSLLSRATVLKTVIRRQIMKKSFMAAAFLVSIGIITPSLSHASCTTFGITTTCSDGNSYSIIGNSVYGSNSRTGSRWSQTKIGNSIYGRASNGNSWSRTQFGNTVFGTDSRGKTYSYWK